MGVDLDTFNPIPHVDGKSSHGGYCGPVVKPIALNMVSDCARDPEVAIPISGIGGVETWSDAAEFLVLGASNVQVCTAAMLCDRQRDDLRPKRLPRQQRHGRP